MICLCGGFSTSASASRGAKGPVDLCLAPTEVKRRKYRAEYGRVPRRRVGAHTRVRGVPCGSMYHLDTATILLNRINFVGEGYFYGFFFVVVGSLSDSDLYGCAGWKVLHDVVEGVYRCNCTSVE